ncbi:hypothetical protein LEP1GSC013_2814 [Leptospira interrogans serovar Valbuzzi str. Duyster]|nr:hypothetical protein LEP1GSC013_2814 [Leptospira interrogans serovar Valbuzzi str. Duyster]
MNFNLSGSYISRGSSHIFKSWGHFQISAQNRRSTIVFT